MYYSSAECEEKALLDAAFALCAAARTAPKGRGRDFILTAVVTGEEKEALAGRPSAWESGTTRRSSCGTAEVSAKAERLC